MRYQSGKSMPKERVETSRERAARQRQERRNELTYSENDYRRYADNRERVQQQRQEMGFGQTSQGLHTPQLQSDPITFPQSFTQAPSASFTEDELDFLDHLADDMTAGESHTAGYPLPSDNEFMFSDADMEALSNIADELTTALTSDEEGNEFTFSEDDMTAYRENLFPTFTNHASSFSLDSSNLPTLPMGRGLADCGQYASGISGGDYRVGTTGLDNSVSPLNYVTPHMFERTFALTREQFITSAAPPKAQGIAFLVESTGVFHYGKLNLDGSVSQTDANSFGFFNSQRERFQRSTMDVVTFENKEAFALYCDIIYGDAGVYFYVYFN